MFGLPQPVGDGTIAEGSDDEHPITLYGDKAEEFRELLQVLYHPCVNDVPL